MTNDDYKAKIREAIMTGYNGGFKDHMEYFGIDKGVIKDTYMTRINKLVDKFLAEKDD